MKRLNKDTVILESVTVQDFIDLYYSMHYNRKPVNYSNFSMTSDEFKYDISESISDWIDENGDELYEYIKEIGGNRK